tara:strand:- start:1394 stop:1582 length:189 start_codon:yes stop_codon:yes gene_type:complete
MPKQLWEKERNNMFWDLVREYKEDGYDTDEAKKLAKKETDEVMADKKDLVNKLYDDTLNSLD